MPLGNKVEASSTNKPMKDVSTQRTYKEKQQYPIIDSSIKKEHASQAKYY